MYFNAKSLSSNRKNDKKSNKKRKLVRLSDGIKEFSELTSLHGFKYIGENRSLPEKIFWGCVLVCVFVLCGFQTVALIKYWMAGKIIMTQENAKLHVWDVPFPAITICSENQLNRSQFSAASYDLEESDYQDLKDYADMMCHSNYFENFTDNKISNKALKYAYKNLVLPCNKTIIAFFWINDIIVHSCQYFQPIVMEAGLCYSHNLIPISQLFASEYLKVVKSYSLDPYFFNSSDERMTWNPTDGFSSSKPITPPWRVSGAGVYNSVKMMLDLRPENFHHFCNISGYGMTVIIHSPIEFPPLYNSFFLRPSTYNVLLATPEMVTVSEELRGWSPFLRGCYFQNEKYLRFFRVYSLANCDLECRANKTRRACGCAAFGHPRVKQTPVCGLAQRRCISLAGSTGHSIFKQVNASNVADDSYYRKNCLCLPSCTDLTYNFEITEMKKNGTHIKNLNTVFSPNHKYTTILEVYYKTGGIDEWHRSPMIRFTELVARIEKQIKQKLAPIIKLIDVYVPISHPKITLNSINTELLVSRESTTKIKYVGFDKIGSLFCNRRKFAGKLLHFRDIRNILIANIGGIMSLCVGCSIISLFEVIYFITLRRRLKDAEKIRVTKIVPTKNNVPVVSIFVN